MDDDDAAAADFVADECVEAADNESDDDVLLRALRDPSAAAPAPAPAVAPAAPAATAPAPAAAVAGEGAWPRSKRLAQTDAVMS